MLQWHCFIGSMSCSLNSLSLASIWCLSSCSQSLDCLSSTSQARASTCWRWCSSFCFCCSMFCSWSWHTTYSSWASYGLALSSSSDLDEARFCSASYHGGRFVENGARLLKFFTVASIVDANVRVCKHKLQHMSCSVELPRWSSTKSKIPVMPPKCPLL